MTLLSGSAVGIEVETGRVLWRYPHVVDFDENINTPMFYNGFLFITASHKKGSTLLKLNIKDKGCDVEKIWHNKDLDNQQGGVILLNGYLFGHGEGKRKSHYACVEFNTGRTMYSVDGLPGQSVSQTTADNMLYMLSEKGEVALMKPDPKKFDPVSRFFLPVEKIKRCWAHPVVLDGKLYIRYMDNLFVYAVRR